MAKPPPPVGTVEQGYRFMGGDPRNKASWQPIAQSTGRELYSRNEVAGLTQPGAVSDPVAPGAAYLADAGMRPKMFANTEERLGAMDDVARQAQSMRVDANRFADLNDKEATGGLAGLVAPVLAPFDPGVAEMRAISERMTPLVRAPGSGAMSDRDVQMYRKSVPNMGNPRETNKALSKVIDAGARRESDFAAFMNEWARRNNSLVGAEEAWRAYADANPLFKEQGGNTVVNPWTPWRKWFGIEAPKPQTQRTAPPTTPSQNALIGMAAGRPDLMMGKPVQRAAPKQAGVSGMSDAQLKAALGL